MTQLALEPQARASDPTTSHLAAASISSTKLRESQAAVLEVMGAFGPMTHEELVEIYNTCYRRGTVPCQSPSGIRTRAKELTVMGKIMDTGERQTLTTGRKAIVWKKSNS